MSAASIVLGQPTPEAARIGIYVLAAILSLLVCGLASIIAELREEGRSRP